MADNSKEHGSTAPAWSGFLVNRIRPLTAEESDQFKGRRILITGAGGYLGSALARALAKLATARLILLDQSEYNLYRLEQELTQRAPAIRSSFVVGSVLNRPLLQALFAEHVPEITLHAAALKHVPLMETNPFAAAETNVLGTAAVLEAARVAKSSRMVFLSTDKAADPVSIMGVTKRVAECLVLRAHGDRQDIGAVRLCNVLGSTGSVAPLFARQLAQARPLTLTDADATRFFITRTDAVRCLLRACMQPAKTGLAVPRLEQPTRMDDLASFIVRRATQRPSVPLTVTTGLRPGEKLHEQMLAASEIAEDTADPQMLSVRSPFDQEELTRVLPQIEHAIRSRDVEALLRAFRALVPAYPNSPAREERI